MIKPSISEPVTELRRVPIRECGEPLVELKGLDIYPPFYVYERQWYIRERVAGMLHQANASLLKKGYKLSIVEGWRPPHIQRRMYISQWEWFKARHPDWSETQLKRTVNRFTAPIHGKVPPPHTTGGAVDLMLTNLAGESLDHWSPYERRDPANFITAAPKLGDEARKHRDLLIEALLPTGLTNYPSEYWHWSFGDQGWAYRGGHEAALYGPIEPDHWEPIAEEVVDAPLNWA